MAKDKSNALTRRRVTILMDKTPLKSELTNLLSFNYNLKVWFGELSKELGPFLSFLVQMDITNVNKVISNRLSITSFANKQNEVAMESNPMLNFITLFITLDNKSKIKIKRQSLFIFFNQWAHIHKFQTLNSQEFCRIFLDNLLTIHGIELIKYRDTSGFFFQDILFNPY